MKQKILDYLKNHPKTPAGKIATILGINYYTLLALLEEMEKDNLVIRSQEKKATYWNVK